MKYIYFDCYAGFDLQMALGSLISMSENERLALEAAKKLVPGAELYTENVRRQSMDALYAYFDISMCDEGMALKELVEKADWDNSFKDKLKRWLSVKDDGIKHDYIQELKELVYCAACLELINSFEADKLYISAIKQGSGVVEKDLSLEFIPSKHTELLGKMAGIPEVSVNIEKEISTRGALAFLYVLNAEYMKPGAHNVIKSGYGAGEELLSLPNITRCILANENQEGAELNFDSMFSEFECGFSGLAKTNNK